MSHGGGDGEIKAEPNLTPMLDLVLQLVMFFMLVANFSMEQTTAEIALPSAQTAAPTDKTEEPLYLNVRANGNVKVTNREDELDTPDRIRFYLKQEAADIQRKAAERGAANPEKLETVLILRADRSADYETIYRILQICKEVGFTKLQLRANIKGSGGK